jgi:hypothetical protein
MADVERKTDEAMPGPWLLDRKALAELDKVFDEQMESLEPLRKRAFEKEVRKAISERKSWVDFPRLTKEERRAKYKEVRSRVARYSRDYRKRRALRITFGSGHTLRVERFSDAFVAPEIANEMPTAFNASIAVGQVEASVSLSTSLFGGDLRIDVSPSGAEGAYETYIALRQWAEAHTQPYRVRLWRSYSGLQWVLFCILLIILVFAFLTASLATKGDLRSEAAELLKGGKLNKGDEAKAIELLLMFAADMRRPPSRAEFPLWPLVVLAFSLIAAVLLSFVPRSLIGIGAGEQSIKRWLVWIRIATVTIPAVVLGGFIVPFARELLRSL